MSNVKSIKGKKVNGLDTWYSAA